MGKLLKFVNFKEKWEFMDINKHLSTGKIILTEFIKKYKIHMKQFL